MHSCFNQVVQMLQKFTVTITHDSEENKQQWQQMLIFVHTSDGSGQRLADIVWSDLGIGLDDFG